MEFVGLGAEMAQLAGRFGSVVAAAAARADLEWSLGAARRLRGMIDAQEASVTFHLEVRIREGIDDDDEANRDDPPAAGNGDQPAADEGAPANDGGCDPAAAGGTDQPAGDGCGAGRPADTDDGDGSVGGGHRETAQEYRARLRRGKWLRRLPLFAAALEAGTITTAHVEALAAVLDHVEPAVVAEVVADEDALLEVARTGTRASFARYVRLRVDRIRDDGGVGQLKRQIAESFGSLG